jgi:2-iminobutanoate/2-iminopropanoate deaminase
MAHEIHDIGVARHIGRYSDAIESASGLRWLHTSGTPGLEENGDIPADIESQSALAWQHILTMLKRADMSTADIVKVNQYLTRPEHVAPYVKVRSKALGEARPAFLLLVVSQLIRPEVLVEVEVIAAR